MPSQRQDTWSVIPPAQLIGDEELHFVGNAGPVARFVSAASLIINSQYGWLEWLNRVYERPQADRFSTLRSLGVAVDCHDTDGVSSVTYVRVGRSLYQ